MVLILGLLHAANQQKKVYIDGSRAVVVWILAKVLKNVNVTTIMFLMSGDLTGLCLYIYFEQTCKTIKNFMIYGLHQKTHTVN